MKGRRWGEDGKGGGRRREAWEELGNNIWFNRNFSDRLQHAQANTHICEFLLSQNNCEERGDSLTCAAFSAFSSVYP